MNDEQKIQILQNALINILGDAQYVQNPLPIIKATAKAALDQVFEKKVEYNYCAGHKVWWPEGTMCPICKML